MGIHGLWRLLEPAGRDVTLESLENKVLAIDVSLWLYQAQQGSAYVGEGVNTPNFHLLTLFHRISKLLFYRVKPVFVFDGVAPGLKKKTISARNQKKQVARDRAEEMRQQLLLSLAKSGVVDTTYIQAQADKLNASPSPKKGTPKKGKVAEAEDEDLYKLPPLPKNTVPDKEDVHSEESSLSDEDDYLMSYYEVEESSSASGKGNHGTKGKVQGGWKKWNTWVDPHEVDVQSEGFKTLPVEVRREILTDLKEARKESSWGRLHKMPKDLGNFSNFQMSRLLHRRKVQEVLEEVEEELASSEVRGASIGELEAILVEKGVAVEVSTSQRIASDENKGFILLSGLNDQKKAKGDEKKTDPSKLATVKEEPEDFGESDVKKEASKRPSFDSGKSEDATGEERQGKWAKVDEDSKDEVNGVVASQPTLKEEEMLSSNSIVKQFLMSVTETSVAERNVSESGEFESLSNAFDEESCPDDLSQREIMAIIKNQVTNEESSNAEKVDSRDVKGSSQIKPPVQSNLDKEDVIEVIEGFTSEEEEESGGLTQEQMMKILCDQKASSADVEDVKIVVSVPKKGLDAMTIPEPQGKISNPISPAGTDDEVIIENSSRDPESDGSDFLAVEDFSEHSRPVSEKSCVNTPEIKKVVVSSKPDETSKETIPNKKLEVVVDLTADSGDADDIFADVFNDEEPRKCVGSKTKMFTHEDTVNDSVLVHVEKQGDDDKPAEIVGGVAYIEEISASESDDVHHEEKIAEDPGKKIEQSAQREEVVELTEEERHKLALELRKKELEGKAGVTKRALLESQELLGLFGVPWIVAPYEAEAQCAFLESTPPSNSLRKISFSRSLVEGTVTEDSDIWAFGASNVYRHVFDRRRTRVRVYSKVEVERRLGMNRIRMVQLALLTGSDYTEGIPGIGTVSALEILSAFPGDKEHHQHMIDPEVDAALSGLQHFADWWRRVEMNEKEGTPIGHSYFDPPEAVAKTLKRRLISCLRAADKKYTAGSLLPPGFPSKAVVQAYLKPSVDDCTDAFTWLKPDEAALRSYARLHFGWTQERIDSVLRPLFSRLKLSDCVDRKQMSLHSYFSHINVASNAIDVGGSNLGTRTKKALERIAGKRSEEEVSPPPKKKGRMPKKAVERAEKEEDQEPVAFVEERVINDDDFERREPSGKLQLLRQKFAKEVAKTGKPRASKLSIACEAGPSSQSTIVRNRFGGNKASVVETGFASSLYSNDRIPQREKDSASALQSKMKAIEVIRKTSIGRGKRVASKKSNSGRGKKLKRLEVCLSESSDSD